LGEGGPKLKFQKNIAAIETLRQLDAEERPATPEEKATLIKYVGWGAMPQVFDVDNTDWRKEQFRLSEILSDEEHRSARATTLNAHYTAPTVIGAMYRAAERFGFKGGRVLEPACGIGHFVGLMPEDMLRRSTVTGIEIDPLTARIAKALYPDADIRAQPFEQTKIADGFYDLAISNVPFGDYTVHDPRFNNYKFSIHDYFFAAALEKVRPGGLLMFITSRGTMDKLDSTLREDIMRPWHIKALELEASGFKHLDGFIHEHALYFLVGAIPTPASLIWPTGAGWMAFSTYWKNQIWWSWIAAPRPRICSRAFLKPLTCPLFYPAWARRSRSSCRSITRPTAWTRFSGWPTSLAANAIMSSFATRRTVTALSFTKVPRCAGKSRTNSAGRKST
jgi:SAM-dependent methyltransferase